MEIVQLSSKRAHFQNEGLIDLLINTKGFDPINCALAGA